MDHVTWHGKPIYFLIFEQQYRCTRGVVEQPANNLVVLLVGCVCVQKYFFLAPKWGEMRSVEEMKGHRSMMHGVW
jgi:hypothetical protein